jgi:alkylation response protein AidB-like acyl-CoA dehydrogenase
MKTIQHPSEWLDSAITSVIRKEALEAEQNRQLAGRQLQLIFDNRWFKMFVPARLGGLGLSLSQALRIEEGLAWADGSTAWVVTLCSGAGWFVGFLDQDLVNSIVADERFCIAGSGSPTGVAEKTEAGYRINGAWKYASGSLHATMFTVNCAIDSQVRSFALKPSEVSIKRTWNAMGIIGTGSHSLEVKDQFVPSDRCFVIDASHTKLADDIYQYPFLQLAETTLAVNISGLASRFLDLASEFTSTNEARKNLDERRLTFFNSIEDLSNISSLSHQLVRTSRDVVNLLYPLCGLRAADVSTEINRVWRNLHTAAQHAMFRISG